MLKDIAAYVVSGAVSVACLGLLALVMVRDTIKDIDVGPFD